MKSTTKFLALILVIGISFFSCKKKTDDEPVLDTDTSAARDYASTETVYTDAQDIAVEAGKYAANSSYTFPYSCATISLSGAAGTYPITATVDFGTTNTTCFNGKTRKGTITVVFTGAYDQPSSQMTVTFTNFYVNDNKVNGTLTISNLTINGSGNLTQTYAISSGSVLYSDGSTATLSGSLSMEWTAGRGTLSYTDDVFMISGNATGVSTSGTSYSMTIGNRIMISGACKYITQGTVTLAISGKENRTINFGTGACDNSVTVSIGSKEYTVALRE
ncbi:MAG: hypothetical protein IAF38_22580 [Bacteroidia bacterium]|nr:hypothetical protein [Bacteroidia bacterium]